MSSGHAKGLLFNYLRDWVVAEHGPDAWVRALERATPRERALYDGLILASSWQPVAAWNELVRVFFEHEYLDPNAGMRTFCKHLAEQDLTSLVKMVLKMGSPPFLLKRTEFLWRRYFDAGRFGAREVGHNHWLLWLEADPDVSRTPNQLTCANGPGPWLERGFELCGRPGTVRHVRCRYDGAPRCEFEAKW
jgi:hypothetical protein